ncbi:hypothetical protein LTR62_002994 [Meristemomyces frigidus]|uniref:RING-type domain-containing protein n=1 Tax=Meristemomyces frigidus TaxID=1508187 RepID=A0AAN7TIV3_9PEZI|nr:hypothetical protein LTR62_002994 [Meristemomyces frigidus]
MDVVPPLPRTGRLWKTKADFFRPFRSAAASETGQNITLLYDPSLHLQETDEEPDLRDLNGALSALVDIFPDVEPEAVREMLLSVSESSRVEIVTEQLLKKHLKWHRGRIWAAFRKEGAETDHGKQQRQARDHEPGLTNDDMFRHDSYKSAVKQVLYKEFSHLNHSTIKAVMAEQNYSYTLSRPILQQLASRTWRSSFANMLSRRSTVQAAEQHPYIAMESSSSTDVAPAVRRTGSAQLDHELYQLFVDPISRKQGQDRLAVDHAYATEINQTEAEDNNALFDCECCYDAVPFERMAVCDDACHQLCFDCIRRSTHEAMYGQGWAQTIDTSKSTLRCFASSAEVCAGALPAEIVRRALYDPAKTEDVWEALQNRAAGDALLKSGLPLQRCPFCEYAEVDEVPPLRVRRLLLIWSHIATRSSTTLQIMILSLTAALVLITVPVFLLASLIWIAILLIPPLGAKLDASWSRVYKSRSGHRFKCQNPSCARTSCIRCTARWRDPHVCFENEKTSLRTAIESSATAAVKRTCPRCLLSFVKSSGCNKLVCNCGYTMCYICRQEITAKEGYGHFCQHFRPSGGRCVECERCDLYGDEDEEGAIRKAAAAAELAWREKEGGKGGEDGVAAQRMVDALVGRSQRLRWWDIVLDTLIDAVAA